MGCACPARVGANPSAATLPCVALLSPRRSRRRRAGLATLAAGLLGVLALVALLPTLFDGLNPFKEDTRDRSQPVLLRSLEDLSSYRAASANLEVFVDVERDAGALPSFLKGERTLFLAAGTVDAAVDFSRLGNGQGGVRVSEDRRSVAVTLPAAELTEARIDPKRSRVYDRDRGLIDRVGDALGDNPTDDQELYVLAERKLREAAQADDALRRTAERNTRQMLEGLLRGLGFERIDIRFERPQV